MTLEDKYRQEAYILIEKINETKAIFSKHMPSIGYVGEELLRQTLNKLLPNDYAVCQGFIAKDKNKSTVTLLTPEGVVTVKFRKEYFSMFDKQISEKNPDGTKTVLEKSWFNRGNMIVVQGIRRGDEFVAKKYASTNGHQLYHIDEVLNNGDILLRSTRIQGDDSEDID